MLEFLILAMSARVTAGAVDATFSGTAEEEEEELFVFSWPIVSVEVEILSAEETGEIDDVD